MLINVCLGVAILTLQVSRCVCYVSYELFPGFSSSSSKQKPAIQMSHSETTTDLGIRENPTTHSDVATTTLTVQKMSTSKNNANATTITMTEDYVTTTAKPLLPTIVYPKFNCSEEELPLNIGPYEVPTQRDLVRQIQDTLKKLFNEYQDKALVLLQDIQQATKATSSIEKRCLVAQHSHGRVYRRCVKEVSRKCELITKSLLTTLERQRADVSAFIEGTICNVTEMRADPVQLIKTLASETASLEFALPGFLRLLASCSVHCDKTYPHPKMKRRTPVRHMTDQDLVVKHFLTKKTYVQLIN